MKHKYDIIVTTTQYHEFDGDEPPDSRKIRAEILKSMHCGYYGQVTDIRIVSERHGLDAEGPRKETK